MRALIGVILAMFMLVACQDEKTFSNFIIYVAFPVGVCYIGTVAFRIIWKFKQERKNESKRIR